MWRLSCPCDTTSSRDEKEMGRRNWHTLLGIVLLLVTVGHCERRAESRQKARQSPLDLILQGMRDSNHGDRQIAKRYSTLYAYDKDYKHFTKEKAAFVPRLDKPIEVVRRDPNAKEKFIKHFAGPISFSSECSKQFHRLYYNTRDCSTPAYYKRCARLLTRLAMSPLCAQH
ncbi:ALK and LTK ligand 1 isoform X2 [Stegostoma tigrinum]|uniref:ALK and LTK ligand 1 isoform X2 n=1 Tax=Stegostoma tigrinum TaxID=3053191 RepID=UPI00202B0043|nr:ALK and LTK ligand 1 isoform X2 [Stegostoma tigrinum]